MEKGTTGRAYLDHLREWRDYFVKTQEWLSEQSGVSRDTIIDLEWGRRKANYSTIGRLAKALGISPRALLKSRPPSAE